MANEDRQKIVIPLTGLASGQNPARGLNTRITTEVLSSLGSQHTLRRASHVEPTSELSRGAIAWLYAVKPETCRLDSPCFNAPPQSLAAFEQCLQEQYPTAWWADLIRSVGPVLGPFPDNYAALAAEETWLHENHIPLG